MAKRKRRSASIEQDGKPPKGFGRPARIGLLSLVLVFPLLGGCANIRFQIGNRPNTDVLESPLRIGESARDDVLEVLGQPDGKGRVHLPIDLTPRTMWSYYYEEGTLKDARRMFLFVFFFQDKYNGYMWFSSLPE